ncbi:MAG TPA: hypothetical protein VJ695_04495 [Nitrososphaera sp.]|nr:hypothetical protein [Nitrososphaera sp.]
MNDSSGIAAAAYTVIKKSPDSIPRPARPLFERLNLLKISELETAGVISVS